MNDVPNVQRWTIVGLLSLAGFINYQDRGILSIALPMIGRDLNLDPTGKGILLSAFFWSYAFMQLPMGWLSDRMNLRWFYAVALAIWSLACGFVAFASGLAALLTLRVILGVAESIYLPAGIKVVSLLFASKHRGLASGLINCGTRAGLAIGVPMTAWLIVRYGWREAFALIGFTSLAWLIPWLLLFPNQRTDAAIESGCRKLAPVNWRSRNLISLCAGHVAFSYYWYLFVTWLPDYLVESRHMPLKKAGAFAVIPFAVFTISEPLGGWVADRLIRVGWEETLVRKVIITLAFLSSLALLLPDRLSNDKVAIAFVAAASLVGLATGNILALIQRLAPDSSVGIWTGIVNFSGNISGVIAPLVTGILISRTGSHFTGFAVAVTILLAGLPAYWFIRPNRVPELISAGGLQSGI